MQMVSINFGIPFLTLFLSAIIFTTTVTCQTVEDTEDTEDKEDTEDRHIIDFNKEVIERATYRLPTNVKPIHYDIGLIALFEPTHLLHCKCVIDINVIYGTRMISLHSRNVHENGLRIRLISDKDELYTAVRISHNNKTDILHIHFDRDMSAGLHVLTIMYDLMPSAEEEALLKTIYKVLRFDAGINTTTLEMFAILMTNVQSIEARQWFPCWDEPSIQTTFRINLLYDGTYTLWPNISDKWYLYDNIINWKWASFNISQQIPASNVMFGLVNSAILRDNMLSSTPRADMTHLTSFTNDVIKMIEQSQWYKIIPASTVKLEHKTIPFIYHDVIGKGSIIIYREVLVTYDEKTDNNVKKMEIARTVAHAMVHQALDNSYGLLWWNHLWLKEGLAMLLHAKILDEIFPKWQFLDLFVVEMQCESFRLDGNFSMPLEYNVKFPSEIKSLFSYPLYVKAPAILHMIKHIIGTHFQELIMWKTFLQRYTFIQPSSLWATMASRLKKDMHEVAHMMKNWVKKNYYPYVRVDRIHYNGVQVQLMSPFVTDNAGNIMQPKLYNWWVPITWTTMEDLDFTNTLPQKWLNPEHISGVFININHDNDWVIVNIKRTGYYRVLYDEDCLAAIVRYLQSQDHTKIHVLNRAQIIDDAYYFWREGQYSYKQFIEIVKYLSKDMDYVAWYPMLQMFRDISRFYPYLASHHLQYDMRTILIPLLVNLTYEDELWENDLLKWLRQEAARWACTFDAPECLTEASRLLQKHMNDSSIILSPWKEWTYCNGAMRAEEDVLEKLQLLLDTCKPEPFNYCRCSRKPLSLSTYLFQTFNKSENAPIQLFYDSFVEYSVGHIDKIWFYFNTYNISEAVKPKLLFIIITRLYSIYSLDQLKTEIFVKEDHRTTIRDYLLDHIEKRMDTLFLQEKIIRKLLK